MSTRSARNGQQGDGPADRVERDDHHRVGQGRLPVSDGVHAHQQHVDPLAVLRYGSGRAGRAVLREPVAAEDLGERLAKNRSVPIDRQVGDGDQGNDHEDPRDPEPAAVTLPSGVEKRLSDGQQAPGEDQQVQRQ